MHNEKKKPTIDYLTLLKQQFNALQVEHVELRKKYETVTASASPLTTSDSFPSRLLELTRTLVDSYCCNDYLNRFFDSKLNPTPIVFYAYQGNYTATIRYRYEFKNRRLRFRKRTNGYDSYEFNA
ncbi:unnamed protein product [Caenorhabditis bovis]|uniref:Uncharacterized protein n=1 Tax=Caenorhabditis bovis TaxID=2654633 RepID=A0A8S1F1Q7_9PELO|nr:unnamed protein product [Caenorhabditis bovis]